MTGLPMNANATPSPDPAAAEPIALWPPERMAELRNFATFLELSFGEVMFIYLTVYKGEVDLPFIASVLGISPRQAAEIGQRVTAWCEAGNLRHARRAAAVAEPIERRGA